MTKDSYANMTRLAREGTELYHISAGELQSE